MIDLCLKCNVWPRIDRCRDELIVRGDDLSCSQCLFNLIDDGDVHRYSCSITGKRDRDSSMVLNRYVSMKIDRALALNQDTVS